MSLTGAHSKQRWTKIRRVRSSCARRKASMACDSSIALRRSPTLPGEGRHSLSSSRTASASPPPRFCALLRSKTVRALLRAERASQARSERGRSGTGPSRAVRSSSSSATSAPARRT